MFKGSLVALITPMDELGNLDERSLQHLIEYHIRNGTTGLVIVGTSGESATLDNHEHIDVIKCTVDIAAGRIPIIAGTGANSTSEAVWLTEQVSQLDIAGCLTVTPYYNKPMQQGLFQHFKVVAESTALPQILYNVPSRTGCDLQVETVARLAEIDNIVALKEATGDLKRVKEIRYLVNKPFSLLSGDDLTFLDFMQLGGDGNISVTANVAANEMAQICSLALQGEFQQAQLLQNRLSVLHKSLFMESNPIPIKWACYRMGLIDHNTLRLPLTALSSNVQHIVENALKLAGLL